VLILRKIVSCMLIVLIPAFLPAQDSGGAIVTGKGIVWVNGSQLPGSSTIVPGDIIQTRAQSMASVSMPGSTLRIEPDTVVKFGTKQVFLDRGKISVATSQQVSALALDALITPVGTVWTEFEVSSVDGNLLVLARKASVNVSCGMESQTLSEGQQLTRDHAGHCTREGTGAYPSATGLTSGRHLLWAGLAVGGGGLLCLILCGGGSNPPASPSKP
jgi:ferric-dicitrate binding protein FerR (iron transport regulator)